MRGRQRDTLALAVALMEHKAEAPGQSPPSETPQDRALRDNLSAARLQLEELNRQRIATETAPAEVVQVANYPTPLSQTVDGPELQFQLIGGRLAMIPMEQLTEEVRSRVQHQIYKLEKLAEFTDTVGPGKRLLPPLHLRARSYTPEEVQEHRAMGYYAVLKRYTVIPMSETLGEPVAEALRENSQLRRVLAEHAGEHPTITIWTYPDGFAAFRRLKEELHRLGFVTAGRPLMQDTPIQGSPQGSKSAAE